MPFTDVPGHYMEDAHMCQSLMNDYDHWGGVMSFLFNYPFQTYFIICSEGSHGMHPTDLF